MGRLANTIDLNLGTPTAKPSAPNAAEADSVRRANGGAPADSVPASLDKEKKQAEHSAKKQEGRVIDALNGGYQQGQILYNAINQVFSGLHQAFGQIEQAHAQLSARNNLSPAETERLNGLSSVLEYYNRACKTELNLKSSGQIPWSDLAMVSMLAEYAQRETGRSVFSSADRSDYWNPIQMNMLREQVSKLLAVAPPTRDSDVRFFTQTFNGANCGDNTTVIALFRAMAIAQEQNPTVFASDKVKKMYKFEVR